MNKDKQIDEMAKAIFLNCHCGLFEDEAKMIAKFCYQEIDRKASDLEAEIADLNAIAEQYRKQFEEARTDVANDVIDEIFKILDAEYRNYDTQASSDVLNKMYMSSRNTVIKITAELVELKKKYTEGEG